MTLKKRLSGPGVSDKDWQRGLNSSRLSVRTLLASHPEAPEEVLKELVSRTAFRDTEVKLVAARAHLSEDLQTVLYKRLEKVNKYDSDAVTIFFANPVLNPRLIKRLLLESANQLARYDCFYVLNSVATSPLVARGLGELVIDLQQKDTNLQAASQVAENPATPTALLERIFKTYQRSDVRGSRQVIESVMKNPALPVKVYENHYFKYLPAETREQLLEGLSPRVRAKALEAGLEGTTKDVLVAAGKSAPEFNLFSFRGRGLNSERSEALTLRSRFDRSERELNAVLNVLSDELTREIEPALDRFEGEFSDRLELYQNLLTMRSSDSVRRAAAETLKELSELLHAYEKLADSLVRLRTSGARNATEILDALRFKTDAYGELRQNEAALRSV